MWLEAKLIVLVHMMHVLISMRQVGMCVCVMVCMSLSLCFIMKRYICIYCHKGTQLQKQNTSAIYSCMSCMHACMHTLPCSLMVNYTVHMGIHSILFSTDCCCKVHVYNDRVVLV